MPTILTKRSSTASAVPTSSQLTAGETAVNTADAYMYTKHTDGSVKRIGTTADSVKVAAVGAIPGGNLQDALSAIDAGLAGISGVPVGSVIYVAMSAAPDGYLKANGAAVSRTTYAALFSAIGITFGAGDSASTFNLPDLRGEFIRGFDDGRGIDAGRGFGSAQTSELASHGHTGSAEAAGSHTHDINDPEHSHAYQNGLGNVSGSVAAGWDGGSLGEYTSSSSATGISLSNAGSHTHSVTVDAVGGSETRPRNVALLACIKY